MFTSLPSELVLEISLWLSPKDLLNLARVRKVVALIISYNHFWRDKYRTIYGNDVFAKYAVLNNDYRALYRFRYDIDPLVKAGNHELWRVLNIVAASDDKYISIPDRLLFNETIRNLDLGCKIIAIGFIYAQPPYEINLEPSRGGMVDDIFFQLQVAECCNGESHYIINVADHSPKSGKPTLHTELGFEVFNLRKDQVRYLYTMSIKDIPLFFTKASEMGYFAIPYFAKPRDVRFQIFDPLVAIQNRSYLKFEDDLSVIQQLRTEFVKRLRRPVATRKK